MNRPSTQQADRGEFKRLLKLARKSGWSVPNPDEDSSGPAVWMAYWRAMVWTEAARARGEKPGRPVVPHIPGQRPPEDVFERSVRINRNRALWRGYLT